MGRSPCCAKEGLNRGAWTAIEDQILTDYINTYGEGDWRYLPKRAGLKRCGKSCRLRWLNYLRPDIKRGNITRDEEDLIIRLHKLLGNRWSLIAGRLPGRTDNEIKNYWNTNLSKKVEQLHHHHHHRYRRKGRSKKQQLPESPVEDIDIPTPVPTNNIKAAVRTKAVRCTRPVSFYPSIHRQNYQPNPPDYYTADRGAAGMIIDDALECAAPCTNDVARRDCIMDHCFCLRTLAVGDNYDDVAVLDFGGFDECLRYLPDLYRTGLDEFSDIDNVDFGNYEETVISNSGSISTSPEQQPEMLFFDEVLHQQDDYWNNYNWISTTRTNDALQTFNNADCRFPQLSTSPLI